MTALRSCILAFFIALARDSLAEAQAPPSLAGVVQDAATARPVIGAIVMLGEAPNARTTRSDERGVFQFPGVAPLSYTVTVRRLGFAPVSQRVTVAGDTRITIDMARLASLDTVRIRATRQGIYGIVATASDLRPLPGARVQVFGSSVGEVMADSSGAFVHSIRSTGAYLVRATFPGFGTQTVSVTVRQDDGVEVALLLDSTRAPRANQLEAAFFDFRNRMLHRGNASAVVPRAELLQFGDGALVSSLQRSPSFGTKVLRFSDDACVFLDGTPRPRLSADAISASEVEAVEVYSATAERSGTLAERWPKHAPCGSTGMGFASQARGPRAPGSRPPQSDVVRWIVIWLKQ